MKKIISMLSAIAIVLSSSSLIGQVNVKAVAGGMYISDEDRENAIATWSYDDLRRCVYNDEERLSYGLDGTCVITEKPESTEALIKFMRENNYTLAIIKYEKEPYVIELKWDYSKWDYTDKTKPECYLIKTARSYVDPNKEPIYTFDYVNNTVTDHRTGETKKMIEGESIVVYEAAENCWYKGLYEGYLGISFPEVASMNVDDDTDADMSPVTFDVDFTLGDLDNDGAIDLMDLSALSIAMLGDQTLSESQQKAVDIDGNGEVNLADLATLKQYVSKAITTLG